MNRLDSGKTDEKFNSDDWGSINPMSDNEDSENSGKHENMTNSLAPLPKLERE